MHKIYDALHGFIRFNALEKQLIDGWPFQRLHSIHQLGITYLVYPGATHSRFEHSIGTMEIATRIVDRVVTEEREYWRQIIRLAALCHDLGHLPFSHDAEGAILPEGHEEWTWKVICSLQGIEEQLTRLFPGKEGLLDVAKMAIGAKKLPHLCFSPLERVLSQIITGDFFGADRIDYLLRDARCTGVSHGLFDYLQLIETLRIVDGQLTVEESGIASCEALLIARHFMHQRVYQHPSVKAHKFHLARFMQPYVTQGGYLHSLERYLSLTDHEIAVALRQAAHDPERPGHADAAALLLKRGRFRALPLPDDVKEIPLPQEMYKIEPAALKVVAYEPLLERCQIRVEPSQQRWIYVHPDGEKELQHVLLSV